jgi:hypothetical protein
MGGNAAANADENGADAAWFVWYVVRTPAEMRDVIKNITITDARTVMSILLPQSFELAVD